MKARLFTLIAVISILFLLLQVSLTTAPGQTLLSQNLRFQTDNSDTENLAPNPSFEEGTTQPDGWRPALLGATYTWNLGLAHTGSRSVCISNVEAHRSVEWDTVSWIPVQAGASYRLGVWVTGDSDREAYYDVAPLDANGSWLLGYGVDLPYNNTTWTYTEAQDEYTPPPDARWVVLVLGVNNPGGFTSSSVCFDDIVWQEIGPALTVDYSTGAPGSFFTFTGSNFPSNSTATIAVNGHVLGTIPTDTSGSFVFLLNTDQADAGHYFVTANTNPSATASFVLGPDEPLRPQEGSGEIFNVPGAIAYTNIVYLPLVHK